MGNDKDYYEEIFEQGFSRLLWTGIAVLIGVAVCVLLSSCKTEYITVPEYHYDYHHSTDTVKQVDSVYNNITTIIRETNNGDSTLLAQLGLQLKEGQRAIIILRQELERVRNETKESKTDTIVRQDSVRVPYPVERKLGFWEKVRLEAAGAVVAIVAIGAIGLVRWLVRRRKIPPTSDIK